MINVLFLCSGNLCRSPMAEGLLKKQVRDKGLDNQISVRSAGTLNFNGKAASENAVTACRLEYNVDISSHRAQPVSEDLLSQSHLILCMGEKHIDHIQRSYPGFITKTHLLKEFVGLQEDYMDVADPIGMDLGEYTKTCHEIAELVSTSLEKIILINH